MIFHELGIEYYVGRLKNKDYFSFAGFSDAEWFCVFGLREGSQSGLGQVFSAIHGKKLQKVLFNRQDDSRFLIAVPKCIRMIPGIEGDAIDRWMETNRIKCDFYERDMVLDDLAREAGLFPLIQQLQKMRLVMIGPKSLRGLDFLPIKKFIEIPTPNCHMKRGAIEYAVKRCLNYGKPAVYLVSAGVSAAVIIDQLHNRIPNSFFIDCGSIWDAFVGIGGQRQWRAELYSNSQKLEQWKYDNLHGKS